MAVCLYCKLDAGPAGYHEACVPQTRKHAVGIPDPIAFAGVSHPRAEAHLPQASLTRSDIASVRVVDIEMSFGSMVVFMVKWALASIPAFVILAVLGAFLVLLARGMFGPR